MRGRYNLAVVRRRPEKADDWCEECGARATYWLDLDALCDQHFSGRMAEYMFHAKLLSKTTGAWSE